MNPNRNIAYSQSSKHTESSKDKHTIVFDFNEETGAKRERCGDDDSQQEMS